MSFLTSDIKALANLLKQPDMDSDSDGEQVSLLKILPFLRNIFIIS